MRPTHLRRTRSGRRVVSTWTSLPAALMLQVQEPSPHQAQFVSVEEDVRLEVLSFGGTGRPIVLLAGMGNTAHVFDELGPELTGIGSVYAVTRRGFGVSTVAPSGYDVGRLGEDVRAVLDSLRLERALIVGHSIAGQELSYLGSEHPDRIAGLVYLDAAYRYAYDVPGAYERVFPDPPPPLPPIMPAPPPIPIPEEETYQRVRAGVSWAAGPGQTIPRAIYEGRRSFTEIPVPVLAIFSNRYTDASPPTSEFERYDDAVGEWMVAEFARGVPTARVLRWPGTDHFFFLTHEADVVREIRAFVSGLR